MLFLSTLALHVIDMSSYQHRPIGLVYRSMVNGYQPPVIINSSHRTLLGKLVTLI